MGAGTWIALFVFAIIFLLMIGLAIFLIWWFYFREPPEEPDDFEETVKIGPAPTSTTPAEQDGNCWSDCDKLYAVYNNDEDAWCEDKKPSADECDEDDIGDEDDDMGFVTVNDIVHLYHPQKRVYAYTLHRTIEIDVFQTFTGDKIYDQDDASSDFRIEIVGNVFDANRNVNDGYLQWGDIIRIRVKPIFRKKMIELFGTDKLGITAEESSRGVPVGPYPLQGQNTDIKIAYRATGHTSDKWVVMPWCNVCSVRRDQKYVKFGDDISLRNPDQKLNDGKYMMFKDSEDPNTQDAIFAFSPNSSKYDKKHLNRKYTRFRFYQKQD